MPHGSGAPEEAGDGRSGCRWRRPWPVERALQAIPDRRPLLRATGSDLVLALYSRVLLPDLDVRSEATLVEELVARIMHGLTTIEPLPVPLASPDVAS